LEKHYFMRKQQPQQGLFYKIARKTAEAVGSPYASITVVTIIIIWAVTGPVFNFLTHGSWLSILAPRS
jgi:low affinity Fe/Cu permease